MDSSGGRKETIPVPQTMEVTKRKGCLKYKPRFALSASLLWFEIDDMTEYLCCYTSAKEPRKLLASFPLEGSTITTGNKSNKFKLILKTKKGRKYAFDAADEKDSEQWKDALIRSRDFIASISQSIHERGNQEQLVKKEPEKESVAEPKIVTSEKDLLSLPFEDLNGKTTSLRAVLGSSLRPFVLMVLRHYGCALCKKAMVTVSKYRLRMAKLGIGLIAVGNGTTEMARQFKEQYEINGRFFVDQQRLVFLQLNLLHGLKTISSGMSSIQSTDKNSDGTQLGGMFVITQTDGVIFSHVEQFGGDMADMSQILDVCENYLLKHDRFSSSELSNPTALKRWPAEVEERSKLHLFSIEQSQPFKVERGTPKVQYSIELENDEENQPHYANTFASKEHSNYFVFTEKVPSPNPPEQRVLVNSLSLRGLRKLNKGAMSEIFAPASPESTSTFLGILSVEDVENADRRAIMRMSSGDRRFVIPFWKEGKEIFNHVSDVLSEYGTLTFQKVDSKAIVEDLKDAEADQMIRAMKFGAVLVKKNQTTETEFYSNETSESFEMFLSCIATKVPMLGWPNFKGGLDDNNRTGTHSYYSTYRGIEVMFHVAPLIPVLSSDVNFIERKRHTGNDVVLLIFLEEGAQPIDPATFLSHFNHAFVAVQPLRKENGDGIWYRIEACAKDGVPMFGPLLYDPPLYKHEDALKDFILAKLINAERASLKTGSFVERDVRTRSFILDSIFSKYTKEKSSLFAVPTFLKQIEVKRATSDAVTESRVRVRGILEDTQRILALLDQGDKCDARKVNALLQQVALEVQQSRLPLPNGSPTTPSTPPTSRVVIIGE